jgi:hypothetical protein
MNRLNHRQTKDYKKQQPSSWQMIMISIGMKNESQNFLSFLFISRKQANVSP